MKMEAQHSKIYRIGEKSSKNTVFSNTGLFQETKTSNKLYLNLYLKELERRE